MFSEWLASKLEARGRGARKALAEALGIRPEAVTRMLSTSGERRDISAEELAKMAEFFGEAPPLADARPPRRAMLVGHVGAGAEAHYYAGAQGPFDEVDAPPGSTAKTVAVEIRGDSLGDVFDKWLVFYDDVRSPVTPDLIGRLCVVGLDDGRVLVKKIGASARKGRYHLTSNAGAPILDAKVEWAAKVLQMAPK